MSTTATVLLVAGLVLIGAGVLRMVQWLARLVRMAVARRDQQIRQEAKAEDAEVTALSDSEDSDELDPAIMAEAAMLVLREITDHGVGVSLWGDRTECVVYVRGAQRVALMTSLLRGWQQAVHGSRVTEGEA